eukprot:CAMPEP_0194177126 /NCGR_PEP_ID=MMETSP0154-20130528/10964_1 /TAXON_ID=1049557 /ORGANISM="Thalassiothrix antarctica, Strain L6-D1" /LENGTH=247 /DNA_ID=CAMNT_0038891613 /DNA_START=78 /DNA_END=821 /DNA_ORIENTATION=-
MAVQQRRGKLSKSNTTTTTNNKDEKIISLEEQLHKAEVTVLRALEATHRLHVWWRLYMFGICFLVLFISFYQLRKPIDDCMTSLETIIDKDEMMYSFDSMMIIIKNSICEILGLVLLGCIISFLSQHQEGGKLSDKSFICATLLVFLQITVFFQNRTLQCQIDDDEGLNKKDRPFPISIIFYAIMTVSTYFMTYQMKDRRMDVLSVQELRRDLTKAQSAQKKGNNKKEVVTKEKANKNKKNGHEKKN